MGQPEDCVDGAIVAAGDEALQSADNRQVSLGQGPKRVSFAGLGALDAAVASSCVASEAQAALLLAAAGAVGEQRQSSKEFRTPTPHPRRSMEPLLALPEEVEGGQKEEQEEHEASSGSSPRVSSGAGTGVANDTLLLVLPDVLDQKARAREEAVNGPSGTRPCPLALEASATPSGHVSGGISLRRSGARLVGITRVPSYGGRIRRKAPRWDVFEQKPWDERHQLTAGENSLLPRSQRQYFSRPASLPSLRQELQDIRNVSPALVPSANTLIRNYDSEDAPAPKSSPITADAGPATLPERHQLRGCMLDRDGRVRMWNDRWHAGVHVVNDTAHPLHRQYFTKESVLEHSPSQRWRRHLDHEVRPGMWHQNATDRPMRFPPLGGPY